MKRVRIGAPLVSAVSFEEFPPMPPKTLSAWPCPLSGSREGLLVSPLGCDLGCAHPPGDGNAPAAPAAPRPEEPNCFPALLETCSAGEDRSWSLRIRGLRSWCFFWLATKEMRLQDASTHRHVYSSISVQLIDQCMLRAAVARGISSPASRINKLLLPDYEPTWMLTCFQAGSANCT